MSDTVKLTAARQAQVLMYLSRCNHATSNTMRRVFRGASTAITLRSLEKRGYVTSTSSPTPMSWNRRWDITDAGREAVAK